MIAEVDSSGNVMRSYAWGLDLAGATAEDEDNAGGIGGLLTVAEHGSASTLTNHFAAYDGNGNIVALVRADTVMTARYEYNPFGEGIRLSGLMAKANPFRFSTRFTDEETGLLAYAHRLYSPNAGRWISRDPKAEDGGANLFAFVLNNPISAFDPFGLDELIEEETKDEADPGVAVCLRSTSSHR